ncbi:hypothetical protein [Sphingobacterium rhinopitheci]|uniref:hypothetical protein n=1 Tax=Sphingobacterium rhinopitheci TaxID=2781960 RepID=UPI001F51BBC2|nr:hypothetical protein [Sphingobacterium rhinopitheci]
MSLLGGWERWNIIQPKKYLKVVADRYTIKGAKSFIEKTNDGISYWIDKAKEYNVPEKVLDRIFNDFNPLI